MRCFIALDIPKEALIEIKKIQEKIKKKNLFYGKITEIENLHLTLKFLGEVDEKEIERIKSRLREVKIKSFEVVLGEVGVFSKNHPRILWIKLNGKGIFELQKEVEKKVISVGGAGVQDVKCKSQGVFMSHITIARIKNIKDMAKFNEYLKSIKPRKIKFKVNNFYLKSSELLSEGAVYSDLEEYTLV